MKAQPTYEEVLYVVENMRARSREEMYFLRWNDDPVPLAEMIAAYNQFVWVGYYDEKPAAIIGAMCDRPGVWTLFGFGTDDYKHILKEVAAHALNFMMPALQNIGAHRAHCFSPVGHTETHKWLRMLGAEEEAVLAKYGRNGEDVMIFAWLRSK